MKRQFNIIFMLASIYTLNILEKINDLKIEMISKLINNMLWISKRNQNIIEYNFDKLSLFKKKHHNK